MFIYSKIIDYLEFLIKTNQHDKNYIFPSENQLCKQFNASRITVRRAFKELADAGKIYSQQGKGYFISQNLISMKTHYQKKLSFAFITTQVNSRLQRSILEGVNYYCNQNKISCATFFSFNDSILEQNKLNEARLQYNGILLFPCDDDIYSTELFNLINANIPVILIDRYLPGLNLTCISSNHSELCYEAIKYFYKKDIKDIVYISHQKKLSSSTRDRQSGIEKGLLDFMGTINKHNFIHEFVPSEKLYEFYYEYFKSNPHITGIVYTASQRITYLLQALKDLGRTPNKDIFIIIIDDELAPFPEINAYNFPTVIQDGFKIGLTAAKKLLELTHKSLVHDEAKIHIPVIYKNWN